MTASADPRIDRAVTDAIEVYCRDVLAPKAAEIDAQSIFATCHLESLAAMGVMGLNLPATAVNGLSDGAMVAAWLVAGFALYRRKL